MILYSISETNWFNDEEMAEQSHPLMKTLDEAKEKLKSIYSRYKMNPFIEEIFVNEHQFAFRCKNADKIEVNIDCLDWVL